MPIITVSDNENIRRKSKTKINKHKKEESGDASSSESGELNDFVVPLS